MSTDNDEIETAIIKAEMFKEEADKVIRDYLPSWQGGFAVRAKEIVNELTQVIATYQTHHDPED